MQFRLVERFVWCASRFHIRTKTINLVCKCNISKIQKFVLFADDTNIFCSGHDAMQLSRDISNELDKLSVWFAVNKLILNVSKTNVMVFGNSKHRNTTLQVSIKNSNIKRVHVTKCLGILIDGGLNWKEHISLICSRLSKCIAIIYKAKQLGQGILSNVI